MKKKKILFYGNCILSTIGKWLHENYSDKFEIIDCAECGVNPSHSTKNFAIWMDNLENQKKYYKCVHEKIKSVDYFVFQGVEGAAIDELRTDYLIKNVVSYINIAVPNFRFYAFPVDRYAAKPFIKYIYNNISKDKQEIIKYLTEENDPKFKEIVFTEYEKCMNENKKRFETHSSKSDIKIKMLDFLEKNWKNHQLFGTHNHPIGLYWREMIGQLFEILEESLDLKKIDEMIYPNKNAIIDLKQFHFMNMILPDLKSPEEIKRKLSLNNLGIFETHDLGMIYEPMEQYLA
jgi:hypothetical protein